MPRLNYTPESVARALDAHAAAGLIRRWRFARRAEPGSNRRRESGAFRVLADLTGGESGFELRTLREAYVFVAGLASARHAVERQAAHPEFALSRAGDGQPLAVTRLLTRNPGPDRAETLFGVSKHAMKPDPVPGLEPDSDSIQNPSRGCGTHHQGECTSEPPYTTREN